MRTLRRHLDLPTVSQPATDETSFALFLPRRTTRFLYRILAMALGIALGVVYARVFMADAGMWWTIVLACVGAILCYVVVLMPAVIVHHARRLYTRASVGLHARALRRAVGRLRQGAERVLEDDRDDAGAWEALGVASFVSGELQRAAMAFERASELSDDGGCRLNLSAALAETREMAQAADLLVETVDDGTVADAARHNIGVLLSRRPPRAVVETIINEMDDMRVPAVLSGLGAWEFRRGDLEMAERYFQAAIREDPAGVAPRANLALVSYRRGNLSDAIKQMHDASALDPMHPGLANGLGALVCMGGRPMAGAKVLSRAALLSPGSPAVELNRGNARLALGQYDDALESFSDGRVRDEWPVRAAHNAALALIGLDRENAAREQLQWGLEQNENATDLLNNLACLTWLEGDEEEARQQFAQLEAMGEDPAAALNLAAAEISRGRTDEALELLEDVRERRRDDDAERLLRGLALFVEALREYEERMSRRQRERFFQALHRCVRPLDAVSDSSIASVEARTNLALFRYLRLDFDEAVDGFRESAEQFPEDGFLQFCLGTALAERAAQIQEEHSPDDGELVGRAREDLRQARRHLERAVDLGEVHADVFCNLGMCAYDLGDTEGAIAAFKRMVQLEDGADAANNLAIVHARETQRLQHEARAAGLASRQREERLESQARTHISTALHYFQKALRHTPRDPILHGNLGLAYMLRNREDDVEAALRHWQRMLALGGERAGRRYEELTALAHTGEGERAEFDEALMEFRPLDPHRCLVTVPPRLSGPRYALQPISEETEWRLVSDDPDVREVLRKRDRLSALRKRLARLSL